MVGMLCGVTIFAYVTSTVSSLLTTFNTQNIRTQEQQRNIDGFCRSHQIPKPLARKMSGFYDYVLPRQIHSEDKDIISGLPETLQQQVRASSLFLRGVPSGTAHSCDVLWSAAAPGNAARSWHCRRDSIAYGQQPL